jgi:hypothetical protein
MALHFIFEYSRDPRTREYENVPDDTPPPEVGGTSSAEDENGWWTT